MSDAKTWLKANAKDIDIEGAFTVGELVEILQGLDQERAVIGPNALLNVGCA